MENINVESKSKEFISILNTHFKGKVNLSRLKLITMFVFALCKVQTVGFEKLANAFDSDAMAASSLRRIQRFIAHYALDSDLIARLIFALLPYPPEQLHLVKFFKSFDFYGIDVIWQKFVHSVCRVVCDIFKNILHPFLWIKFV